MRKKKRTIILSMILLALVITFLREMGWVKLDWYSLDGGSTFSSDIATLNLNDFRKDGEPFLPANTCVANSKADISVVVELNGKTESAGDPNSQCQLKLSPNHESSIGSWLPIFKRVRFSRHAWVSHKFRFTNSEGIEKMYHLSGPLYLSGEISVIGLCSHRKFMDLLDGHILDSYLRKGTEMLEKL